MTSGRIPIADHPAALTPAWLTDVLTATGRLDGARVVDVVARPLGTGQMCDSFRLSLGFDGPTQAPATVVAKLPAADAASRSTAVQMRSYEKEVRFYQVLAPDLPVRTPGVHHADIDLGTGAFTLLLEDLAPAEQGDQLIGCTPDEAALAMDELVRLHATRWGDPALAELGWLANDTGDGRRSLAALLPLLWDGFRDRYGSSVEPHVRQAGDVLFAHMEAYLAPPDDPGTIVHGDFRLDNLLFDRTPGSASVAVVDWQTCTVGPGPWDVAYFLGAGLDEHDRREAEVDIVRRYHGALVDGGVDYGWDDCWLAYRRGTWSGLLMAVGASMLVERTPRGDQMFLTMAARHAHHILDHDAPDLLTGG